MQTETFFSENAVREHAAEIARCGRHALVVTGRHSAKANGSLDDVCSALSQEGVRCEIFSDVEENPSVETVLNARDAGTAAGCDFVIGIGGGSPMDAAKAIALMMANPEQGKDFLYDAAQEGKAPVPIILIPTTCGTGSEATGVSVLTRHDLRTKKSVPRKLFPDLALLDAFYLKDAPFEMIRNTAVDAAGHMIESFINTKADDESRIAALTGLALWGGRKDYLLYEGRMEDYLLPDDPGIEALFPGEEAGAGSAEDERMRTLSDLLLASNYGGKAIAGPGTSLPHALSYKLTYEKHVPHGMAIGVFLPGFMEYANDIDRNTLLFTMGWNSLDEFREFIRESCLEPMLRDYVTPEEIRVINAESIDFILSEPARIAKVPYPVDRKVLEAVADLFR